MIGRPGGRSVLVALLAAVPIAAGCSSGGDPAGAPAGRPKNGTFGTPPGLVVARWWSNSAVQVGSMIDAAHPTAASARLRPSRRDYCGMLRQTLRADKAIVPGAGANDPALALATRAFIGELQKVAPAQVSAPWQVLGKAVLTVVGAHGDLAKVSGIDSAKVAHATTEVARDAKTQCQLDLSTKAPHLPKPKAQHPPKSHGHAKHRQKAAKGHKKRH